MSSASACCRIDKVVLINQLIQVALKQCLGLPKPLWHEVMELCGGECATLSRLETPSGAMTCRERRLFTRGSCE